MTKVVFIDSDDIETVVDADNGTSLMEAAFSNDVEGILAECGGACACATCHVWVDEPFLATVGEAGELEQAMLEFNDNTRPNSRLSCQIEVSDELDGLRVRVPESQM